MFAFLIPDVFLKNRPNLEQSVRIILWITVACLCFTLAYSASLWLRSERLFAPSPIIPVLLKIPHWVDWVLLAGTFVATLAWVIRPRYKALALVFPTIFAFWVLQDSLRWQPFLYMYAFVLVTFAFTRLQTTPDPRRNVLLPLQIMVAGVYFWAGIGKVNVYFYELIFPWFVGVWLPNPDITQILAYAVPWMEALIGVFLLFKLTRPLALFMAFGMLCVILVCLGPLGHNWGMIVWPWNVFLFSITFILFLFDFEYTIWRPQWWRNPLTMLAVVLFGLLPLAGQFGYWGAHPSFKLYSGDVAVGMLHIAPDEDINALPEIVRPIFDNEEKSADITTWTIREFSIASTPSVPSYGHYVTGAKGLCPYLQKPDQAYVIVQHWQRREADAPEILSKTPLCTPSAP